MSLSGNVLSNDAGVTITEGSWITVSSKHHCIYIGKAAYNRRVSRNTWRASRWRWNPRKRRCLSTWPRLMRPTGKSSIP
jgi:hypothetical protein